MQYNHFNKNNNHKSRCNVSQSQFTQISYIHTLPMYSTMRIPYIIILDNCCAYMHFIIKSITPTILTDFISFQFIYKQNRVNAYLYMKCV